MTEETNKPTKATPAEETVRKIISIDTETKVNKSSASVVDPVSQSPDRLEETPVVRKLVVPDSIPTTSDPDDDRSPGLVGRSAGPGLKSEEKSQLEKADESKNEDEAG